MDKTIFERFSALIYEKSGINLGPRKEALVAARVGKRMRALGLTDYRDYLDYVSDDPSGQEVVRLLDAVSTNVTSFFREARHFEILARAAAEWADKGQRKFRLWSAACSSGEEPYTIAMTMLCALSGWDRLDLRILATDISTRVLEKCRAGIYEKNKVDPVPAALLNRFFQRHADRSKGLYAVKDCLRKAVVFERLNLAEQPFPMKGPFDAIFCRNVMIYFDTEVRGRLLAEIKRLLRPGGYLFVGHAESLAGAAQNLETIAPSVYRKG